MDPNEERSLQEYWEVDDAPPDPTVASTDAEFVAELGVLLEWSGLSLAEIEHRARAYDGYVPDGAVSDALREGTLPSEQLLLSLLWAVGCDDATVQLWVSAREGLAAGGHAHFDDAQFEATQHDWVPREANTYSEGTLAHAVKERRDQSGWRGLHRRAFPGDGDAKRSTKHSAKQTPGKQAPAKRARAAGKRARVTGKQRVDWSSRMMIALVAAGVLAFGGGIVAVLSGGGGAAAPPGAAGDPQACCPGSGVTASQTPTDPLASTTELPTPGTTTTKTTQTATPRPSTTTRGPSPSPTQTQTQTDPPKLAGSGNWACAGIAEGRRIVMVSLSATLSNASSGTDPQGQAGGGASFGLSGSGTTSFSGQKSVDVGAEADPPTGTISWSVTVTVAGTGDVSDSGSVGFNCP